MEDGEKVIDKIEKGFGLITKARNLCLHLKGDMVHDTLHIASFKHLSKTNYYNNKQHKFMALTKLEITKDFIFLVLITKETRDILLASGLVVNHKRIKVSVTCNKENGSALKLRINMTLVTNNLM